MKLARIYNDGRLAIKGELIEKVKEEPLLYFNGVSQAVTIANTNNRLQPSNTFTWEMWFKLESYTQYNTLMGFSGNNFDFGRMDSTTRFRCHTWDSNGNQTFINPSGFPSIDDGEWHHMAIVWDGINGRRWGFIDGVQRDYATMEAGTNIGSTAPFGIFTIGGATPTGRLIKGWIKEVRMWQKARTQAEILSTMDTKLVGNEDGLFVYLPLDEGKGSTLIDKSSGFEVNINGAIWEGDTKSLGLDTGGNINLFGELIEYPNFNMGIKDNILMVNELIEDVELEFNPSNIDGCVVWLDANDANSITKGLDNRINQWNDKSGNGNHANQENPALQPVYSKDDASVYFNMSFMDIPNVNFNSGFTICTSIKPSTLVGAQSIIEQYDWAVGYGGFLLRQTHNTIGASLISGTSMVTASAPLSGERQQILAEYGTNFLKIYVDGVLLGNTPHSMPILASTKPITLGARGDTQDTNWFVGDISEVIIYDRILTVEEREKLFRYMSSK